MRRTELAEQFVNEFASKPLVREFVFLSSKFVKGRQTKELCDLLLVLRKQALLIQMKCQEDPDARKGDDLRDWVLKQQKVHCRRYREQSEQLRKETSGGQHSRRGRVDFAIR